MTESDDQASISAVSPRKNVRGTNTPHSSGWIGAFIGFGQDASRNIAFCAIAFSFIILLGGVIALIFITKDGLLVKDVIMALIGLAATALGFVFGRAGR